MSDHEVLDALDALVAERDEWASKAQEHLAGWNMATNRAEAAEARVTELEAVLKGRVGHGHNDTCSAMLGWYECTCGQEGAVAALAAPTKEGT